MKKMIYLFATMILSVSIFTDTANAYPSRVEKAVRSGDVTRLQKCIRKNDYLNVANGAGKTPLDLAQDLQDDTMIKLLQDNGAKHARDLSLEEQKLSAQLSQHELVAQQVQRELLELVEQLERLLDIKLSISNPANSAE